ncbi:MAG: DNRLRE domain-containing protein [Pseudomonadota bacterium]
MHDGFLAYEGATPADFMMMLGDNAYWDGTDAEFQAAVFDTYPAELRRLPLWPTLGNHDGHSADSGSGSGPYYDIFDLPRNGEVGGLASGTEAYHSWDYGDIHFINLDSYDTDRSATGSMMTWLESDLALNDKPWVIAFWHHPPYSKGSHDSDTSLEMIDMRQNALPILESWGVDLVLSGHNHIYERSMLLDGHYDDSSMLDVDTMILDTGDGSESGNGAYQKPMIVAAMNEGAVYTVAGSSGTVSNGGSLNHPVMYVDMRVLGSMVLDIDGNRLDAAFINSTGAARDEFTIIKSGDFDAPSVIDARAEDATQVMVDYSERVDTSTATDTANYAIAGLSITGAEMLPGNRSVRLTTSAMTLGTSYLLTVSNVMDEAGNVIAPNSQYGFDFVQQQTAAFHDGLEPGPDYYGTYDTYIREASPNTNYGSATKLLVDGDEPHGSGTDMNILIGWDLNAIPADATVSAASIHLYTLDVGGPYSCYGLLRAWSEQEVTWNDASAGTPWGAPGAEAPSDRDSLPLCTVSAGSTGPITVNLNSDGIALVQSWVDGSRANNGIIITDPVTGNGADFDSSDWSDATVRPRLEVTYTVPGVAPNQPPAASFTASCSALDCSFTDVSGDSDGSIVSRAWDFGDGNTAAAQDPGHTYAAAGTYRVELTVTDNDGATDSTSQSVTVTAPVPQPTAAPTDLTATVKKTKGRNKVITDITLNWSDNSGDETGFVVHGCKQVVEGKGKDKTVTCDFTGIGGPEANVTGFSVPLPTDHDHFRVKAVNDAGPSAWSNTAKI